jgi:hypothetical protein
MNSRGGKDCLEGGGFYSISGDDQESEIEWSVVFSSRGNTSALYSDLSVDGAL